MQMDWVGGLKPTVLMWAEVGVMAITFIVLAKWLLTKYPVAGLSEVVAMA